MSQCVLNGKTFDQGQERRQAVLTLGECEYLCSDDIFGCLRTLTTRIRGVGKGSVSSRPLAADEV